MKDTLIADRIRACLSRIRQANGFATDLGAVIKHGSPSQVAPGTLYLSDEEEDTILEQKNAVVTRQQPYTVEATLPCTDETRQTVAHAALDDLFRAIWPQEEDDELKNLLADRPAYVGRSIKPRTDGQNLVTVQLRFQVKFVFNLSHP